MFGKASKAVKRYGNGSHVTGNFTYHSLVAPRRVNETRQKQTGAREPQP